MALGAVMRCLSWFFACIKRLLWWLGLLWWADPRTQTTVKGPLNGYHARRERMMARARQESVMDRSIWSGDNRKILVLDLDETLVHSTVRPAKIAADFTVEVYMNNIPVTFYVHKRPHVDAFLEAVSQWFVVCIWTASLATYASPVIDRLDPRRVVKQRLYRESCVFRDGLYLKDLAAAGFPLHNTMLLDNSPTSFRPCPANGIAIESWFDDSKDQELLHALTFLEVLRDVRDVRTILSQP